MVGDRSSCTQGGAHNALEASGKVFCSALGGGGLYLQYLGFALSTRGGGVYPHPLNRRVMIMQVYRNKTRDTDLISAQDSRPNLASSQNLLFTRDRSAQIQKGP